MGYDSHRLKEGRRLVIGGVGIPFEKGLEGHSDADVLVHAITDSVLGALGRGDIGALFPDTDPRFKDARSIEFLSHAVSLAREAGFEVSWVDSTVVAESPRLQPYIEAMKEAISASGVPKEAISIKAKTNEGMGLVGRGEGICAFAVCVLIREEKRLKGHPDK